MDIICPSCKTEYEFDDDKVGPKGITVKCTRCNFMFKVRRRESVETRPIGSRSTQNESTLPKWTIRTRTGQSLHFDELPTLQQWIIEQRVGRDDFISRRGETWKRLGDIAELSSFFQVVDAAQKSEKRPTSHGTQPPPSYNQRPIRGTGPTDPAFATSQPQFEAQDVLQFSTSNNQFNAIGQRAAWEHTENVANSPPTLTGELEVFAKHGSSKKIIFVVIGLLLIGGGAIAVWKTDLLNKNNFITEKVSAPLTIDLSLIKTADSSVKVAQKPSDAGTKEPVEISKPSVAAPAPEKKPESSSEKQTTQQTATQTTICKSYACFVKEGDRLSENGRTMKAIAAYTDALKIKPTGVEAVTGLAFCQLDLQRYALAITQFRRAMNLSPTYGDAMIGMAESYKAMGNPQRAYDYYKAYLRANPTGPKAHLADRNAKELERKIGDTSPSTPTPQPSAPAPQPSAPAPQPSAPAAEPSAPTPTPSSPKENPEETPAPSPSSSN